VLCAVSATGIIRTIFFSETVTGDRYIGQFLAPLFENLSDVAKECRFYRHGSAADRTAVIHWPSYVMFLGT
jgi:hypothetical protein